MEEKDTPDATNDVSLNPVRPASSVIICSLSIVGRDAQDNSTSTSDDIASQFNCSTATPADLSVQTEAGYMHSKFLLLHRKQGCCKLQRVLPLTHWEQDFCRSGVGCFRRQRLIWRLHDVSTAYSKLSPR